MRALLSPFKKLPRLNKVLVLLIASFIAAIGFIVGGGWIVYSDTQHLIEMRDWAEHSQDVLANLQLKAQRLDRVESYMRLYSVSGNTAYLDSARAITASTRVDLLQLQDLINDNSSQMIHLRELDNALRALSDQLQAQADNRSVPDEQLRACRDVIAILQKNERTLLRQRSGESKTTSYRSILSGAGYLCICLLILIALFAILLRDAVRRRASDERLAHSLAALEKRAGDAEVIAQAREELQLCVSTQMAYDCMARHFAHFLPESSGAMLIINNSRSMVEVVSSWNRPATLAEVSGLDDCCGLRSGKARWRMPGQSEVHCAHFTAGQPARYLCAPMSAHGETLGFTFICFPSDASAQHALREAAVIHELLELAALSIGGLNLRAKLEHQSIRDSLTGLFNRHFMQIALEREVNRASRRHSGLAVLMLDVDHFKQFNDTHSHEAGDLVLREVGECFANSVRSEDVVCRYGGEEFVIILPDIEEAQALERAEHIRANVERLRLQFRGQTLKPVTVSIGLASYPHAAEDATMLLRLADRALYEAKHSGRNRVETSLLV